MEHQGRDRQRNEGILQRHDQGRVERSGGLGDPKLSLSVPTGVQIAPTSPKRVEGVFSEAHQHTLCPSVY
jgi:hypothetical protein